MSAKTFAAFRHSAAGITARQADINAAHFDLILAEAISAAIAASNAAMKEMGSDRYACGFAWVTVDGNEPLTRYCRGKLKTTGGDLRVVKRTYGSKGYPSGWQWWNPGGSYWQNVEVKEAGARAFRDKLAEHGIRATVGSRLD